MAEQVALSFIIPVYNVVNYIEQCVESIANQGMTECEIILVDDGSTDGSGEKCDILANKYFGIKVFHQHNQGHSSARNLGLEKAIGKYVSFVDSDDYIDNKSIATILDWIKKHDADICFLNGYKHFADGDEKLIDNLPKRSDIKDRAPQEVLNIISRCEKFPGSACTKLFNRTFLKEFSIKFPINVLHGEDLRFVVKCFSLARTFDRLELDFYYYRQGRSGSVTTNKNREHSFRDFSEFILDTIKVGDNITNRKAAIYGMAAYEHMLLICSYRLLPKEMRKEAKKFLNNYKWLLAYGKSRKIRLVNRCVSVFGVQITSYLLNVWMKIRSN